jgi:hypothetical protein
VPCRRHAAKRDVSFHSINEPSCGFPPYFPRISLLRSCAIRENLPDMNLGHSKRQKTAKRSHELRQVVRDNGSCVSDRVLLERMQASVTGRWIHIAPCGTIFDATAEQLRKSRAQTTVPARCSYACLPYGRYSLGSGAVADSACTMMPVTRQPPASLIA